MAENPVTEPSKPSSPSASTGPGPVMTQCSITKKWFPEDELVMFQGQLVSAEGKQILLDRLRTGAEAPGELVCPGRWRRIGCIFLVDGILLWVFGIALNFLLGVNYATPISDSALMGRRIWAALIALAAAILYFGFLHGWKGQSLGKMVGNLRVVNMDGTAISKAKGFARAVAYTFGNVLFVATFIPGVIMKNSVMVSIGGFLAVAWGLTDGIFALIDTRMQRTLHDRICQTRVIWINR